MKKVNIFYLLLCMLFSVTTHVWGQNDPLPSWNDGPGKKGISTFVKAVTDKSGPDYVHRVSASLSLTMMERSGQSSPSIFNCYLPWTGSRNWHQNILSGNRNNHFRLFLRET